MQDLEGLAEVLKLANFFVTVIFDLPPLANEYAKVQNCLIIQKTDCFMIH